VPFKWATMITVVFHVAEFIYILYMINVTITFIVDFDVDKEYIIIWKCKCKLEFLDIMFDNEETI